MILKYIRNVFLLVAIFALGFSCLSAQITMGSTLPPNTGALLDLKEFAPDAQNATSTKGMQLPRVFLTSPSTLADVLKGETESVNPASATGLWIYNVNETSAICPGIYVWDGSRWNSMMHTVLESFDDIRTRADGSKEHNVYPARTFGSAGTWMLENLRATTYADNLGVDKTINDIQVTKPTASLTLKAAYYPNADKAIFDQNPGFGMLYTFAAITNGKTKIINEGESDITSGIPNPIPGNVEQVGAQGICPQGWHVPSDKEWNDLEEVIANEQTGLYTIDNYKPNLWNYDGQNWRLLMLINRNSVMGHGASMKTAFVNVNNQVINGKSASYCNGGFNVLNVGVINTSGAGVSYGSSALLWSNSAAGDSGNAIVRSLSLTSSGVSRTKGSRNFGYSVRCKKN